MEAEQGRAAPVEHALAPEREGKPHLTQNEPVDYAEGETEPSAANVTSILSESDRQEVEGLVRDGQTHWSVYRDSLLYALYHQVPVFRWALDNPSKWTIFVKEKGLTGELPQNQVVTLMMMRDGEEPDATMERVFQLNLVTNYRNELSRERRSEYGAAVAWFHRFVPAGTDEGDAVDMAKAHGRLTGIAREYRESVNPLKPPKDTPKHDTSGVVKRSLDLRAERRASSEAARPERTAASATTDDDEWRVAGDVFRTRDPVNRPSVNDPPPAPLTDPVPAGGAGNDPDEAAKLSELRESSATSGEATLSAQARAEPEVDEADEDDFDAKLEAAKDILNGYADLPKDRQEAQTTLINALTVLESEVEILPLPDLGWLEKDDQEGVETRLRAAVLWRDPETKKWKYLIASDPEICRLVADKAREESNDRVR